MAADGDGWKEAALATAPERITRPYHLLQTPLNRAVVQLSGLEDRPFVAIQVINSLAGGMAAGQVVLLLARLGVTASAATWLAVVFALSATPLLHGRTAETAMTPLPLVLAAWLLLLGSAHTPRQRRARVFAAGMLLGLAVLLSLNLVVLLPAFLWVVARQQRRDLPLFALAGLLVLLPPFAAAAAASQVPTSALWRWLTWHEDAAGLASSRSPLLSAARAVVGLGRLVFPASPAETAVKAMLRGEAVLVSAADWLALARNLLTAVLLVVLALRGANRWRHPARDVVLLAVGLTAATNLVWLGSDPQYWLAAYPLLLAMCWHGWPWRAPRWLGGAVVLGLLLVNGPNTMPSPLWPRWAGEWPAAEAVIQRLQLPCTVVTPGQSALRVAARGQPAMTIVDLSYAAPTLGGQDFLDWLAYTVERAMGQGAVYLEAAEPPFRPRQLGAWEMVEGGHHLRREKVVKLLATRYQLSPVPGVDPWLQRLDAR